MDARLVGLGTALSAVGAALQDAARRGVSAPDGVAPALVRDVVAMWAGATDDEPDDLGLVDAALARHVSTYAGSAQRFQNAVVAFGSGLSAVSGGAHYVEGCAIVGGTIIEHAWIETADGRTIDGAVDANAHREVADRYDARRLLARWGQPLPLSSPADFASAADRLRVRVPR